MHARVIFLVFSLCLCSIISHSQQSKLDSLKKEWVLCEGVACVDVIVDLCWQSSSEPLDSVIKYITLGEELLQKYPDKVAKTDLKYIRTQEEYDNGHYEAGIKSANELLPLLKVENDTFSIIQIYKWLVAMYGKQSLNTQVLSIFKEWDSLTGLLGLLQERAECLSMQGNYYRNQLQNEKAIAALDEAIYLFEQVDYPIGLAYAYLRKGLVYSNMNKDKLCLEMMYKSRDTPDFLMSRSDSVLINDNIGRALFILGRYDEAEPYLIDAIRQSKVSNWKNMTNHGLNLLMDTYFEAGRFEEALEVGEELQVLSKNSENIRNRIDITRNLSELYAVIGNYQTAYVLREEHTTLLDSLNKLESDALFAEMDAKYQVAKKDQAITEQALEIEQRKNARTILIAILSLTSLIAVGIYYWMRQRLASKQSEKEALEEIDQLKTDFFANVSHELRTPLTLISGPINQVMEETNDANHKKLMQLAVKNSNKLKYLINQLLDFSKVEAGKIRINRQTRDIIAFAKGIQMSFESLSEKRGIKLQFFSYVHVLNTDFDADMMEKILSNLLSNAIKFTKGNGEVKLIIADKGDQVEIVVQDTGVGIHPDELPYIFDRFYQAEHSLSKEYEGTGIGLSLVKDLVEIHNGTITAESLRGKGSTFTILLPRGKGADVPHAKTTENLSESISPESMIIAEDVVVERTNDAHLPNLLIIEDNADVRYYIAQQLQAQFNIIEAVDGEEGIQKAVDHMPDLIICDIMMPVKDGYQVTHELKNSLQTSHIPIIMLTAKASRDEKLEGLLKGADDYLIKPFDSKELKLKTRNLVTKSDKLKEFVSQHLVIESAKMVRSSVDKQFLDSAYRILDDQISNEQFSVEDFAHLIGMSSTNLNRKLRSLSDKSTNQFIQSYRLKIAADMLRSKTGNVSQIATEVGFSSNSYFIKQFKKNYGVTPNQYMNQDNN